MDVIGRLIERARKSPARIVFPEATDPIMVEGALQAERMGICKPVFVGSREALAPYFEEAGESIAGVELVDSAGFPGMRSYISAYVQMRHTKEAVARQLLSRPLYFGGMMVRLGDADGLVAGVATITAAVAKAAKLMIGVRQDLTIPSSFFIMVFDGSSYGEDGVLVFADAAMNPRPSAPELAEIAVTTARSARELLEFEPRVAMLSFSTKGSSVNDLTLHVQKATELAIEMAPEIAIDGELQVDSALDGRVAARKVKGSTVAGKANVLIFPDLNAANIAYKIAQYLGGATACGPIFQGFEKPINDLSRGATVEDLLAVIAVTSVQARKGGND